MLGDVVFELVGFCGEFLDLGYFVLCYSSDYIGVTFEELVDLVKGFVLI